MCGLCAALNAGNDWTDISGHRRSSYLANRIRITQRRSRVVQMVNMVLDYYGLEVIDWGGGSYIVSGRDGRNDNVYNLSGIWESVDMLAPEGEVPDPLDLRLIHSLEKLAEG